MRRILGRNFLVSAASLSVITSAFPALAQDESAMEGASSSGEIIVTARKREESILKVPVIVSALPKEQLETYQVTSLQDLPKLVPGLLLGHSLLSIGTLTSIRGVGPTSQDPGVDSSTSLNIDGLSLGNGLAFSSGMFDIGQVEVFKGPQALFYGKSSPAGVISLRTADPTDELEVIARASYEFVSKNPRGELIVSGPVSENLKLRLAAMYSTSRGYFRNKVTPTSGTGALAPPFSRAPRSEGYIIRGTALWEASDRFTARLKLNLVHDRARFAESFQVVSCPEGSGPVPGIGIPFLGGEDCKLDRNMHVVGVDPAVFPLVPNNGVPFLENDQYFGSLELSYDLTDSLNLSSTTGYYKLKSKSAVNASESQSAGSPIAYNNRFGRKQVTEEVRLNSDFAGALNLTLGAFFEDGRIVQNVTGLGNTLYGLPALLDQGRNPVNIKTYSLFGQGRIAITPQLELAAGLRWTDEKRTESPVNFGSPVTVLNPRLRSKNTVPEVTLTYTPTDNLTVFAAYKKAYKSGSFSMATSPRPNTDNSFSDEKVEGGEGALRRAFWTGSLT
ncbi:MAG: TonB-dependent receptor [Novosphingobium sp.]